LTCTLILILILPEYWQAISIGAPVKLITEFFLIISIIYFFIQRISLALVYKKDKEKRLEEIFAILGVYTLAIIYSMIIIISNVEPIVFLIGFPIGIAVILAIYLLYHWIQKKYKNKKDKKDSNNEVKI
jgi:hypothetical protein